MIWVGPVGRITSPEFTHRDYDSVTLTCNFLYTSLIDWFGCIITLLFSP